jgi:sec-independent protein translocase protein TatB
MFDFGFGELLLIAVVALIFLGPERLPTVARMAGLWIRKVRSQWNSVKADLENELADEELRRNLRSASDAIHDSAQQMRSLPESVRNDPAVTDTAAVMTSLASARRARPLTQASAPPSQPTPVQPIPASATADDPAPAQPEYDPTQLSLLDPDLTMQMILLPPTTDPGSGK